jgi:RHS repeat-associated protein
MTRNGSAIVLHRNWRGLYVAGTDSAGDDVGTDIPWPGVSWSTTQRFLDPRETHTWLGSLPMGQQDETGLNYRRNRYYDPESGQFTQQDPIGIAGGLNLYGYANGDPINFSDPFGLKVCFGTGRNAGTHRRLTEEATGTSIEVDDEGCAVSFEDVGGEDYAGLQAALGTLIASDAVFHVFLDEESESLVGETRSVFGPLRSLDGTTAYGATIALADAGRPYPCSGGVGWNGPQLTAHELIGHGLYAIAPTETNREWFAIGYENQYNRAAGRPERCR